jgi:diguanylate cyclase
MAEDKYHRELTAGQWLFREGDPGDCAFVIESGSVQVFRERQGERLPLATLKAGDLIGEMSLIDQLPRSASALSEGGARLRVITRHLLQDKLDGADPLLRLMLRMILQRYRTNAQANGSVVRVAGDGSDSDQQIALSRLRLAQELEEALERREFVLFYQPIVRLADMTTAGYEALIRWNSPTRGFVSPGEFIPLAEESDVIVGMGRWIIGEACRALTRFQAVADGAPLFMSANLAGRQLLSPTLIDDVAEAIRASGIPPGRLKLELTESQLISNWNLCVGVLEKLRATGVQVAVDDFGTGYSSLSYLHRFPADALKVDRSFVIAMMEDERSRTILHVVGSLGHALGMHVIAEGVELAQQAEYLGAHGFEFAQGYLFSKPVPEADAAPLATRRWTVPAPP